MRGASEEGQKDGARDKVRIREARRRERQRKRTARSERQRNRREMMGSGEETRRDDTRGPRRGHPAPDARAEAELGGRSRRRDLGGRRGGPQPGRGGPGSQRRPAAPETSELGRRRGRPPRAPGPPRSRRALPPRGPTWLRRPGPRPRPAPSRPARAPAPHLVEGEELLLELLALRVRALPPEPKLHHLASLRRRARRRRRSRPQDAPHGPAGPEARAGRQEVRQAAWLGRAGRSLRGDGPRARVKHGSTNGLARAPSAPPLTARRREETGLRRFPGSRSDARRARAWARRLQGLVVREPRIQCGRLGEL